jgi:hypothetical protein
MNGVSATDGGFLQVLMTTRGSEALDGVASGGCLGGEENVLKGIMGMEVMFGEFIERGWKRGSMGKRTRNNLAGSNRGGIGSDVSGDGSIELDNRLRAISI